jgi:hypothetical protein
LSSLSRHLAAIAFEAQAVRVKLIEFDPAAK